MKRLDAVRDFIRDLHRDLEDGIPSGPNEFGLMVSRPQEATLYLDSRETHRYSVTVSDLFNQSVKREEMSRRSVERSLQEAMFAALDVRHASDRPFEERLERAIKDLERSLTQPTTNHACCVPVGGLAREGLPRSFGKSRMVLLNERQVRRLLSASADADPTGDDRREEGLRTLRGVPSWGNPALIVNVSAKDFEAAWHLAVRETRRTIHLINFFADLVPYNHGWAYLPGEASRVTTGTPLVRADGTLQTRMSVNGPPALLSIKELNNTRRLRPVLCRMQQLMGSPRKGIVDTLLTSIEWAGRATVETKREEAFLLFAISLETLVLPESDKDELTYRLRTRVPHLLAGSRIQRKELSDKLKKLYRARSRIQTS